MEQRNAYDWLIVVFLHETRSAGSYSDQMKASIEKVGAGQKVMVFLIQDTISSDPATNEPVFVLSVSRLENPTGAGPWGFNVIDSPDLRIDNPDKHCWKTAFQYIYSNYSADRNMLISFSEGAAFGINRDIGHVERPAVPAPAGFEAYAAGADFTVLKGEYYFLDEKEGEEIGKRPGFEGSLLRHKNGWAIKRQPGQDFCKNLEVLWITEMADALERFLPDSYIDIFLMNNCFMQLFDTGYILSKKVKILVAAEGYVSFLGYDYGSMMQRLVSNPAMHSDKIVENIVDDLTPFYQGQHDTVDLEQATLFANRLEFYPLALHIFEELVKELYPMLGAIAGQLEQIRNNEMLIVTGKSDFPLVDANLLVDLITSQVTGLPRGDFYRKMFNTLRGKIVIKSLIGDRISANPKYGCSGISIYFPLSAERQVDQDIAWCAYFDKHIPSPFKTRSRWNTFLSEYFKKIAGLQQPALVTNDLASSVINPSSGGL